MLVLFTTLSHSESTTGAAFLKLGGGARPLALAGAYTAAAGDVDTIHYNPAGLAALGRKELSVTHSEWLEGTGYDVISYGQPLRLGSLGVSAIRLGGGTQEGRNALRQKTGDFTVQDLALQGSYGFSLADDFGLGVSAQYIRSQIDSDSASTVAFDAGALAFLPNQRLRLGASVLHIGSGLRFLDQVDRLPLTVAVGAAYQPIHPLRLSLDVKHEPYDQLTELDTGAEYRVRAFAFRVGYRAPLQGTDEAGDVAQNIRGGVGFAWSRFKADYTLAPFGDLGLTHRFTLRLIFGPAGEDEPKNLRRHE